MKIGIIGAGFTGLSAGYYLTKLGHDVTIFEKDPQPGGLAIGYREKGWQSPLEEHYHHWFINDNSAIELAKEIEHEVIIKTPKSSFYVNGKSYQFDSPFSMLTFPKLPLIDKIRMAAIFAILFRFNPFWKILEGFKIATTIPILIGEKAYKLLWEPQLINKMGEYAKNISLVWFWARIKKRTKSLAYPRDGFLSFAKHIAKHIAINKGEMIYKTEVYKLLENNNKSLSIFTKDRHGREKKFLFDKVIVTLPTHLFLNIAPQLSQAYKNLFEPLDGLAATNMVLRLRKPFFKDKTYWLSICEANSPILVVIEHTNFIDKKYYNDEHIVYLGNYLKSTDKNFIKNKEDLLQIYDSLLIKINPEYKKNIIDYRVFRAYFAQPIIPLNYSKIIPPNTTPLQNVFLANMQQVYPWDRGTNYAIEAGKNIARSILR
ncbi:oxidoreductase [Candidatus Levyibacteriota bacterium]|nr:oxidoreductase [Candidatus Levybacteria bacterium]